MNKVLALSFLSFSLFAQNIIVEKENKYDIGSIVKGDIQQEISFTQTPSSPAFAKVKIAYKTLTRANCVAFTATFPPFRNLNDPNDNYPQMSFNNFYTCNRYVFDYDSEKTKELTYNIRFKTKTTKDRSFTIKITREILNGSMVISYPTDRIESDREEILSMLQNGMVMQPEVSFDNGDFRSIKVKSFLKKTPTIVIK